MVALFFFPFFFKHMEISLKIKCIKLYTHAACAVEFFVTCPWQKTLFSEGEGRWGFWTVLLWTSEAVQSEQALAGFKILLPPFSKKWHGCKVGITAAEKAPWCLLPYLLSVFMSSSVPFFVSTCVNVCVCMCVSNCLSCLSHSLPRSVSLSLCPLQRVQWSGGPVHLMQCAIATLPSRAGDGRGDVAVSEVAETLKFSQGRWHLLHFGDGRGRLCMSLPVFSPL